MKNSDITKVLIILGIIVSCIVGVYGGYVYTAFKHKQKEEYEALLRQARGCTASGGVWIREADMCLRMDCSSGKCKPVSDQQTEPDAFPIPDDWRYWNKDYHEVECKERDECLDAVTKYCGQGAGRIYVGGGTVNFKGIISRRVYIECRPQKW